MLIGPILYEGGFSSLSLAQSCEILLDDYISSSNKLIIMISPTGVRKNAQSGSFEVVLLSTSPVRRAAHPRLPFVFATGERSGSLCGSRALSRETFRFGGHSPRTHLWRLNKCIGDYALSKERERNCTRTFRQSEHHKEARCSAFSSFAAQPLGRSWTLFAPADTPPATPLLPAAPPFPQR
jgi:hypothetical protein